MTKQLEVYQFPCLSDNYGYLVHDNQTGVTAAIDTPDYVAIGKALDLKNWQLSFIFNTHHHPDHAGGNLALKAQTNCKIIGPRQDAERIPGIDILVGDQDTCSLGIWTFEVYDTPGHTKGHIVYFCSQAGIAFVGDTLFALGCGRLFEGTPQQMWESLQKISAWPDDTLIYCAHEYTEANARFALSVEPENHDLILRSEQIVQTRSSGSPTIPTTLGLEKKTNPFLRSHSDNLQKTIGLTGKTELEIFTRTRELKDNF